MIVSDNVIRDCAFSAVRNNTGDNVQIVGNSCQNLGEVALFVEFGFNGCVVANNLVDRASVGISITNFNEGGRLASATGNVLRNLFRRPDAITGVVGQGVGIAVEADAAISRCLMFLAWMALGRLFSRQAFVSRRNKAYAQTSYQTV